MSINYLIIISHWKSECVILKRQLLSELDNLINVFYPIRDNDLQAFFMYCSENKKMPFLTIYSNITE